MNEHYPTSGNAGVNTNKLPILDFTESPTDGAFHPLVQDDCTEPFIACPVAPEVPIAMLRRPQDVVNGLLLNRQGVYTTLGRPEHVKLTGAEGQRGDGALLSQEETMWRELIKEPFSARSAEATRPRVEALAKQLADDIEPDEDGIFNFRKYSAVFTTKAVCASLGLSETDWAVIQEASDLAFGGITGEARERASDKSWSTLYWFYRNFIDGDRTDDVIEGSIIGEVRSRFTSKETIDKLLEYHPGAAPAVLLEIATSAAARTLRTISNGYPAIGPILDITMLVLIQQSPETIIAYVHDPKARVKINNEIGRLKAHFPVTTSRMLTREHMLEDGTILPEGSLAVGSLTAVLHSNELAGEDADEFNPDRPRLANLSSLAYGRGLHTCTGMAEARLWQDVCLAGFLTRFPKARLATTEDQLNFKPSTLSVPEEIPLKLAA